MNAEFDRASSWNHSLSRLFSRILIAQSEGAAADVPPRLSIRCDGGRSPRRAADPRALARLVHIRHNEEE
jgi:hypothetical protein